MNFTRNLDKCQLNYPICIRKSKSKIVY